MSDEVQLTDLIAPPFYDVHQAIDDGDAEEIWLKGGRGSTKSSFAGVECILTLLGDEDANAIVFRKVGDTIRGSVLQQIEWAIDKMGLSDSFRTTTSPAEITYVPTGQKIIFKGLDKALKIKSIKIKKGYFKFVWFEEGAEFSGPEEIRSVSQSVMRGGDKFVKIISYNPPNDPHAWVNKESEKVAPGKIVHHSSYLDVPKEWLGEKFIADAEYLKETDFLAYSHEYLGQAVGIAKAKVLAHKCVVKVFEPQPEWNGPYYGADWGFSQDPNTLVRMWLEDVPTGPAFMDKNGKAVVPKPRYRLYIEYAEFDYGTQLDDIPSFYEKVPGSKGHKIRADCSRPETIAHVKAKGYDIEGAPKWDGSVEDGVTVLQSMVEIVIHTRCDKMQEEARLYSYKIDKVTNDVLADIVDKFNHGWDAVRYGLAPIIKRKPKGFFDVAR